MKHMEELMRCVEDGYDAYVCFVIQMKGVTRLEPNDRDSSGLWRNASESSGGGREGTGL